MGASLEPNATPTGFLSKIYRPFGFKKGYNFGLYVFTVGALLGFTLARLQFLRTSILVKKANPYDAAEYARENTKKGVGIKLHLIGVLVASLLVAVQFTPIVRYKAILVHRLNGYLILLLFLIQIIGSFMMVHSTGGRHVSIRTALAFLAAVCTISISLAYYYIKRLRIDLHREWMIRTWVLAGSVISTRLIGLAIVRAFTDFPDWPNGPYHSVLYCREIWDIYNVVGIPPADNPTLVLYPSCTAIDSLEPQAVKASMIMGPENAASMLNIAVSMAQWLALILHAIAVEVYFRATRAESDRLKEVSRQRRIERGWERGIEAGVQEKNHPVADSQRSASDSDGKH